MSNPFDLSWMVGRTIGHVALHEPTWWSFSFAPDGSMGVECPWRLLNEGRVTISSEDHLQGYGRGAPLDAATIAAETLRSRPVTGAEVKDGTADLLLHFVDGLRLEILPLSIGYESWQVTTPSGFRIVAQGGEQLSGWQDRQ